MLFTMNYSLGCMSVCNIWSCSNILTPLFLLILMHLDTVWHIQLNARGALKFTMCTHTWPEVFKINPKWGFAVFCLFVCFLAGGGGGREGNTFLNLNRNLMQFAPIFTPRFFSESNTWALKKKKNPFLKKGTFLPLIMILALRVNQPCYLVSVVMH